MRPKRGILFAVWALISAAFMPLALFAEDVSFHFTSVSAAGSGGTHNAEEDGVFTLLGNPALLSTVTSAMFFAFSGGIGDVYQEGALDFDSPSTYYTITGPLVFGVASKGIGFGLFNRVGLHYGRMDVDVIAAAGIDWTIINTLSVKLDVGLAPKALFRYRQAGADALSLFAPSVTPGMLLSFGERFRAGIRYDNALSIILLANGKGAEDVRVSRSLDAGIAAMIVSNGTLGLTLFADYRDLLGDSLDGNADSPEHLGFGMHAAFWTNFWLSAGMSGGIPTGGFGLNLGAIKLDIALSDYGASAGIRITRE
jgi:hypothetical protein